MDRADVGVSEANRGMQFAYREFVTPGMLMLVLGLGAGLVILYAIIGSLGNRYTLSWNGRLALCGVNGALCVLICYPAGALALFLVRFRSHAQIALALALYAVIMAAPCGAATYGVYGLFHGAPLASGELPATYLVCAGNILGATVLVHYVLHLRVSRNRLPAGTAAAAGRGDAAPGLYPECLDRAAGAGVHAAAHSATAVPDRPPPDASPARTAIEAPSGNASPAGPHSAPAGDSGPPNREGGPARPAEPAEPAEPPSASFLDRLPAHVGGDVVYLKVAGHYLEVVTTRGSGVILQRLMDAVRELGGRGMQTHRSYWVAHRHIRYFVRRDGRTLLHLTGDYEVPVSRTFLPEVRRHIKSAAP